MQPEKTEGKCCSNNNTCDSDNKRNDEEIFSVRSSQWRRVLLSTPIILTLSSTKMIRQVIRLITATMTINPISTFRLYPAYSASQKYWEKYFLHLCIPGQWKIINVKYFSSAFSDFFIVFQKNFIATDFDLACQSLSR